MLTQTRTKIYNETTGGIPQITSTPGTLLSMLDAVLVNGFNEKPITSLSLAGGIATIVSPAHGFTSIQNGTDHISYPVIQIVGLESSLDGEYRIQSFPNADTLTIQIDAPDRSISGGTVKFAPAGWDIAFSDEDNYLRVYKQKNILGTNFYLRIDDSSSRSLVTVYKTMTDINTGSWPVPSLTQSADTQLEWGHVVYSSSGANKFFNIFADDLIFYLFMENPNANTYDTSNYVGFVFGDIISSYSGDSNACIFAGSIQKNYTGEDVYKYYGFGWYSTVGNFIVDDPLSLASSPLSFAVQYNTGRPTLLYQDVFTQKVTYSSCYLRDSTNNSIRGEIPGMYDPWFVTNHAGGDGGSLPSPVTNKSVVSIDNGEYGILTYVACTAYDRNFGTALVFAEGDWR